VSQAGTTRTGSGARGKSSGQDGLLTSKRGNGRMGELGKTASAHNVPMGGEEKVRVEAQPVAEGQTRKKVMS